MPSSQPEKRAVNPDVNPDFSYVDHIGDFNDEMKRNMTIQYIVNRGPANVIAYLESILEASGNDFMISCAIEFLRHCTHDGVFDVVEFTDGVREDDEYVPLTEDESDETPSWVFHSLCRGDFEAVYLHH